MDEGERRRIHTVREDRDSEKKRGIHTKEQKSRYQGGQEQRHISGQEETDRSDTMETVTPELHTCASSGEPGRGLQNETEETKDSAPSTQHVPHDGDTWDGEEEWRGEGKNSW